MTVLSIGDPSLRRQICKQTRPPAQDEQVVPSAHGNQLCNWLWQTQDRYVPMLVHTDTKLLHNLRNSYCSWPVPCIALRTCYQIFGSPKNASGTDECTRCIANAVRILPEATTALHYMHIHRILKPIVLIHMYRSSIQWAIEIFPKQDSLLVPITQHGKQGLRRNNCQTQHVDRSACKLLTKNSWINMMLLAQLCKPPF